MSRARCFSARISRAIPSCQHADRLPAQRSVRTQSRPCAVIAAKSTKRVAAVAATAPPAYRTRTVRTRSCGALLGGCHPLGDLRLRIDSGLDVIDHGPECACRVSCLLAPRLSPRELDQICPLEQSRQLGFHSLAWFHRAQELGCGVGAPNARHSSCEVRSRYI